jgi:hypothetical protein
MSFLINAVLFAIPSTVIAAITVAAHRRGWRFAVPVVWGASTVLAAVLMTARVSMVQSTSGVSDTERIGWSVMRFFLPVWGVCFAAAIYAVRAQFGSEPFGMRAIARSALGSILGFVAVTLAVGVLQLLGFLHLPHV